MNIRRAGFGIQKFGSIKTHDQLKRYLLSEGWWFATARCKKCKYKWEMAINPFEAQESTKIPIAGLMVMEDFYYVGQPCIKCEKEFVVCKIKEINNDRGNNRNRRV